MKYQFVFTWTTRCKFKRTSTQLQNVKRERWCFTNLEYVAVQKSTVSKYSQYAWMFTNSKYDNTCVWKSDDDKRGVVVTCMCGLWTNGWRGMLRRSITQSVTTPIPPQCWIYVFQKHLDIGTYSYFWRKKKCQLPNSAFPDTFQLSESEFMKIPFFKHKGDKLNKAPLLSRSPPPFPLNAEYMFQGQLNILIIMFLKHSWASRVNLWKYLHCKRKCDSL